MQEHCLNFDLIYFDLTQMFRCHFSSFTLKRYRYKLISDFISFYLIYLLSVGLSLWCLWTRRDMSIKFIAWNSYFKFQRSFPASYKAYHLAKWFERVGRIFLIASSNTGSVRAFFKKISCSRGKKFSKKFIYSIDIQNLLKSFVN